MPSERSTDTKFEIGHVLFIDIVGYSKLLINEQSEQIQTFKEVVRATEQFRLAEAEGKLLRLPTGDGGALVFRTSPEAPVLCALEISKALKKHPELHVRMGIHSGPVNEVSDLNEQANIAGAGINIAQRVMDCGDAGHILLSNRVADDLEQYPQWRSRLHDLGECDVKHGVRVRVVNLYDGDIGNSQIPKKLHTIKKRREQWRWTLIAIALLLLTGVIAGFFIVSKKSARAVPSVSGKSIAVLPFENLSRDPDNAYFADGIQDQILTRLAKIADLKVISRTSTQKYKSAPANLSEIAQQLGVTNILEGSVQKAADQVRISVQLINALNDSHLWAETYDRKLIDVFQVESDVAQKIAASLEAKLTGREKIDIAVVGTRNPEAYDAFLHALALRNKQGFGAEEKVIGFARRAVELDPNYAEAWAVLGIFEALKYFFPDHSDAQLMRARTAAENALRLAPDSADGHAAMGMFYYYCLQDYDRALADLKIAHERAPNDANILLFIGLVQRRQGKFDQSITTQQEAAKLDPLNEDVWVNLGRSYRGARRFDEARAMFDRALTIAPGDLNITAWKAETYLAEGDLDSAGRLLDGVEIAPNNTVSADSFWATQLNLLLYRRQFDQALARLSAAVGEAGNLPPIFRTMLPAVIGGLHSAKGDLATARPLFQQTQRELRALRAQSDTGLSPDAADALVEVDARLGERQEIEREADALLKNAAKDAWRFPQSQEAIARSYAILGDADRAVPLLERLLRTPYSFSITPGNLRLDPVWDPIRNDPRFQKLIQQPRQ